MDPRDAMSLSGSASYYMQLGLTSPGPGRQSGLPGSPGIHPLSTPTLPFQPNIATGPMQSALPTAPSSAIPSQVGSSATTNAAPRELVKRKRGRPRKYGPDGKVPLGLSSSPTTPHAIVSSTQKRGRGRPPGSGRKQKLASFGAWLSNSAGIGFTPHIIRIEVGEDIASKILSFSQQGPRAVCILSANGAVSTVTLRQPSTSGGSVTYEGCFEILCLSGSYLVPNDDGPSDRTSGLSVSLASSDGSVIGGGVGGMLVAASPVQVVLGSFFWGGVKFKNKRVEEGSGGGSESDNQTVDNQVAASFAPTQNLAQTPSVSAWPNSRLMDLQTHGDIDLMRG